MGTPIILWLIFTVLFLGLAIFHFVQARKKIPHFEQQKRPLAGVGSIKYLGMDLDQLTISLTHGFNAFIDEQNRSNKIINVIQALGYLLASLTALFSLYLTVVGK